MNLQELTQQIGERVAKEDNLGSTLKFIVPDHGVVFLALRRDYGRRHHVVDANITLRK